MLRRSPIVLVLLAGVACSSAEPRPGTLLVYNATCVPGTPGDPAELGGLLTGNSRLQSSPTTAEFVPASDTGWSVTLPGDTLVHPGQACSS